MPKSKVYQTRGFRRRWRRYLVHRPVNQQRAADDVVGGNQSPIARIVAVIAVVAQDEVRTLRDDQLAVFHQFLGLDEPLGCDLVRKESAVGKVVAELVTLSPVERCIFIVLLYAVDVNVFIDQADVIARDSRRRALRSAAAGFTG